MKNDTWNYKYAAPTALMLTSPHKQQSFWKHRKPGAPPIHDLRFTIYCFMIGFDRSALVANPTCGIGNQNVNRVVVRFMTKVFRSILSKVRTRQALARPS